MNDAEAANKANRKTASQNKLEARESVHESTALDRRYGQIGISAVAAAVRYQGGCKNPAYAPAPADTFKDTGEAA